ncbi:ankyrin repeat domain-containing protein 66-like [Lytechinus variegatus]|uniref:ankyrin repeat domain-containing protein 66-like n=1 Tax=Lytechinus variegatus TaxID=7654 RepID=UPI001BB21C52|nr:ankyrin repeat domain-containing protein 66-like [Lytechinus variegatus]
MMTELHEAAASGDSAQIELLLTTGKYDINGPDLEWNSRCPIHWAAIKGHAESIRLLASYGARLDVVTDEGWTATHFACEQGKILALRALYKSGALIDMEDNFGDTPQRVAEIYGHDDCVTFINEARIEIEEKKRQAEIEAKIEAERKRLEEEKAKQGKILKHLTEKKEKKSIPSRWRKGKR